MKPISIGIIASSYNPAPPSFDWSFDYTTGSISETHGRVSATFNNNGGSPTSPVFDGANGIDLHTQRGYVNLGTLWSFLSDMTIQWESKCTPTGSGTFALTGPTTSQNIGGFSEKIAIDYYSGGCEIYIESSTNELRYWSLGGSFTPNSFHTFKIVQDLGGGTLKLSLDGGTGVAASNGTVFTTTFDVNSLFASNSLINNSTNWDGDVRNFSIKPSL